MYQQGNCSKCGAPILMPTIWHGINPPQPTKTCACDAVEQWVKYYRPFTNEESKQHLNALNAVSKPFYKLSISEVENLLSVLDEVVHTEAIKELCEKMKRWLKNIK